MAYSSFGAACFFRGDHAAAEKHLLSGLAFSRQNTMTAWEAWAAGFLAHMYAEDGRFDQAVSFYEKAISALESTRLLPSWLNQLRIAMARASALDGRKTESDSSLFDYYGNIRVQAARGWASLHIAEILMCSGRQRLAEAEHWARQAAELDSSGGTLFHLGWDYALLGRIFSRRDDTEKAVEFARLSMRLFKKCGAEGGLRKVLQFEARLKENSPAHT
jgi:tetratricopeptide (TPR) repeat protein